MAGFVPAGSFHAQPVPPGQSVKIMTGAPLPAGCDTVVPVEEVAVEGRRIRLLRPPQAGQHVRRQGEELRRDEELLPAGLPLHAGEMGLLAAAGIERVKVYPAPRVARLTRSSKNPKG